MRKKCKVKDSWDDSSDEDADEEETIAAKVVESSVKPRRRKWNKTPEQEISKSVAASKTKSTLPSLQSTKKWMTANYSYDDGHHAADDYDGHDDDCYDGYY